MIWLGLGYYCTRCHIVTFLGNGVTSIGPVVTVLIRQLTNMCGCWQQRMEGRKHNDESDQVGGQDLQELET